MSRLENQTFLPSLPFNGVRRSLVFLARHNGLRWRVVPSLLLTPLVILSGVFLWQDYVAQHRSTVVEVREKSALVNAQLEDFLHRVAAVSGLYASIWVKMFPGEPVDNSTLQAQRDNLNDFVNNRPHFSRAFIADSAGFSTVSSDDFLNRTRLGPLDLYLRASANGEFTASDVIKSPEATQGIILFVQPLNPGKTGPERFLVLQSELSVISDTIDLSSGFPLSARAGIFDSHGTILAGGGASSPHPGSLVGADISETELWEKAATRPTQEWFGTGLDSQDRVIFFRYPASTKWITTVAYSQSELFQPLRIKLISFAGVLGVSLVATVYLGELLIRRERGVLGELEHGVQERTAQLAATNNALREEIKQRTSAQESLSKSEQQQKALVSAIPDLILQIKKDGTIVNVQAAGNGNVFTTGMVKVSGTINELLPSETATLYSDNLRKALDTGIVQQFKHSLFADDNERSFETRMVISGTGEVVAIVRDITEQKRLEEEYIVSQKLESVGRLAGGIAHEFNNLLSVIVGFSALADDTIPADSPAKGYISKVQQASRRAVNLTSKLLVFSRKKKAIPELIGLNALLFDTERLLRPIIGEDIELVFLPGNNLWAVSGDQGQMQQVLLNLATNARDAMPKGGKLTIKTKNVVVGHSQAKDGTGRRQGSYVVLTVSDTGVGMTDDVKAHLFEPFFTTKEVGKGTGLGLSICYGIVTQSGGYIEVNSQPNLGTNVTIWLPSIDTPAKSGQPEVEQERQDLPRGNETILVVEDEPLVRKLAVQILTGRGYRVLEAGNGAEALSLVNSQPAIQIHLLLTDVVMPQIGGEELAASLRELIPNLKVLFMSGYSKGFSSYHQSFGSHGGFIEKPFMPGELESRVRDILDVVEKNRSYCTRYPTPSL